MSSPRITIDKKSLLHNYDFLTNANFPSKVIPVLKANAYGHGLMEVFDILLEHGVRCFAVARVEEAINIREYSELGDIVVLQGAYSKEDIIWCSENNVQVVIHDPFQVEIIGDLNLEISIDVWLKLNVGMNRLGVSSESFFNLYRSVEIQGNINIIGLISHFSDSEKGGAGDAKEQYRVFEAIKNSLPCNLKTSIFNSAAALDSPVKVSSSEYSYIRAGLSLYGISPFDCGQYKSQLRTVMSLQAPIIAIRELQAGEKVGYNGTWEAKENSCIATVSIGYGDGYPRCMGHDGHVLVGGRLCKIIGLICMDMLMIDLGLNHGAQVGDFVTIWGDGLDISTVSNISGQSVYELLSQLTARVQRIVV